MPPIVGEASIKITIDTSGAEARLDRQQREEERERDREKRREEEQEKKEKRAEDQRRGRRRFSLPSARGMVAAIPFAGAILGGAVLLAEYGPAVAQLSETISKRVLAGLPETIRNLVADGLRATVEMVNNLAEELAEIRAMLEAVFGGVRDTTELAKVSWLFRGEVDPQWLVTYLKGQVEIRKAMGLGQWAERQIRRKAIGEGLGNALADLIKTQE